MNSINLKKRNDRVLFFSIFGILILILSVVGITYAYFSVLVTSDEYIQGSSAYTDDAFGLEIIQVSDGAGAMIPLLDFSIPNAVKGYGDQTCVDANGNTICKVYSIKITNKMNAKINVTGDIEFDAEDMPNLKWASGTSAIAGFPTGPTGQGTGTYNSTSVTRFADVALDFASTKVDLDNDGLLDNSKMYYIVVWISETNAVQTDKNDFTGTVTFNGYIKGEDGSTIGGVSSTFRG